MDNEKVLKKATQLQRIGKENTEKIVGNILENTKSIEALLETVLREYSDIPETKKEFSQTLFNSFFIEFGKKIALLKNINKKEEWLTGKEKDEFFSSLLSIGRTRNAFAHSFSRVTTGTTKEGKVTFSLTVKSFEGEDFKEREYKETLESFYDKCDSVYSKLAALIKEQGKEKESNK
jgi:hypothetical protein